MKSILLRYKTDNSYPVHSGLGLSVNPLLFTVKYWNKDSCKVTWMIIIHSMLFLTHWDRKKKNGCHFTDGIFKRIFLNENALISMKISLNFYHKSSTDNIPALVQTAAWHRPDDLSHYPNQWWLVYWRTYAPLGLNGLIKLNPNQSISHVVFPKRSTLDPFYWQNILTHLYFLP